MADLEFGMQVQAGSDFIDRVAVVAEDYRLGLGIVRPEMLHQHLPRFVR